MKNPEMFIPEIGEVQFPDADKGFESLYLENNIDSYNDEEVVKFLKKYSGFTHTSGDNIQEERRALELAVLSDVAEDVFRRRKISSSGYRKSLN